MLDKFAVDIVEGVNQRVGGANIKGTIQGGHETAVSRVSSLARCPRFSPSKQSTTSLTMLKAVIW
jgi:hypothetical protein